MSRHYARHSHSTSDYTESELAEMTVDPYEETPKCESSSTSVASQVDDSLTIPLNTDTKGIIWAVCGAIAIAMLIKLWKKVKRTRYAIQVFRATCSHVADFITISSVASANASPPTAR